MTTVVVVNTRPSGRELIVDLQDYSTPKDADGKLKQPMVRRVMLKPGPNEINADDLAVYRSQGNAEQLFALGVLQVSADPMPSPLTDPATTQGSLAGVETLPIRVAARAVASCYDYDEIVRLKARETREAVLLAIADRLNDLRRNPDWRFR